MSAYRMRDRREIEVDSPIPGGRYNAYVCRDGHTTLTLDVDEGVTPMFLNCRQPGCLQSGASLGYPKQPPGPHLFPVRVIWRRATKSELKRERRQGHEHYTLGGLALEEVAR